MKKHVPINKSWKVNLKIVIKPYAAFFLMGTLLGTVYCFKMISFPSEASGNTVYLEADALKASYVIFKEGSIIKAHDSWGNVAFNDVDASGVIQAAINALIGGGKILIKQGTYDVGTLTFDGLDNIEITGEGMGKTILRSNSAEKLFDFGEGASSISHFIRIAHLTLDGNGVGTSGIYSFGQLFDSVIEYVEVKSFKGIGISIGRGMRNRLLYCRVLDGQSTADLAAFYSDHSLVFGNYFDRTSGELNGDLLTFAQVKNLSVIGNTFRSTNKRNAIFFEVNLGKESDIIVEANNVDNGNIVVRSQTNEPETGSRYVIKANILNGGDIDLRILKAVSGDIGKVKKVFVGNNILNGGNILIQGMQDVQVIGNYPIGGTIIRISPNTNITIERNQSYLTELLVLFLYSILI